MNYGFLHKSLIRVKVKHLFLLIDNLKEEIIISNFSSQNEISIKENNIDINEKGIMLNEIIPINTKEKEFETLMNIYQKACNQVLEMVNGVKDEYNSIFNKNIINHTTSRIKAPKSIINKMKKKNLELNYKNLVNNINDIAGVRLICPVKDDIYTMVHIIEKIPNWNLIVEKDYIKNPKKSGYSGYHMIVEVPVKILDYDDSEYSIKKIKESSYLKNQIFVKVEIQIRTMAMDFWAENEHKMKYKSSKKISFLNSKRLEFYAKAINFIDHKLAKINRRQEVDNYRY